MDQATPASSEAELERRIPVDVDHAGIRLAVPLIALAGFFILLALFANLSNRLNPDGTFNCAAFLGAVIGALSLAAVADRLLKGIWHSGRALHLAPNALRLTDDRRASKSEVHIALNERVNLLAWRFTVKKGSARIPKGWVMLGCQIAQDEIECILYTFVPPKEADMARYGNFVQLVLRSVLAKEELPLREAHRQRRLLRAEDERWMDGAELRQEDFAKVIDTLLACDPNWQEKP